MYPCTAEHLSSFQTVPMPSDSDASGTSVTLHKDSDSMETIPESVYYSRDAGSSLMRSSQLELNIARDQSTTGQLSTRRQTSPSPTSYVHHDWSLNSGRQAKRARVENIIKGMTSSPGMYCTNVTTNQLEETNCMEDNKMIQELPLDQKHMERNEPHSPRESKARRQLLERQNHHLRPNFTYMDGETETTECPKEDKYCTWSDSPEISPSNTYTDTYSEFESNSSRKYQGWKKVKLMNYFQSKPERLKLMADVLKYELSRAVSSSVDSIFKSMPLLHTVTNDVGNVETDMPLQLSVCSDNKLRLSCCGAAQVQVPDVQTEALSLVVPKPEMDQSKCDLQPRPRAHHHPKSTTPFSHECILDKDQVSEKSHGSSRRHAPRCFQDGCSEVNQSKFETFDTHWNSVKVRSKVNSRSMRSPQTRTLSMNPVLLETLCLPHVKIESDAMVKNNLYMLNEGLTTNHLKKAKLMFFYTRYPSSLVLKMCFHDVQFTRCITSQLIKWFSNFREFYYIQMEKFARHAFMEGESNVRALAVGRESELFRALNLHYNKANDFQVPDRFLEVAEITLREFYIAISMGKDRDPSWKKAIYKVICKLDSDLPPEFKSHHSV